MADPNRPVTGYPAPNYPNGHAPPPPSNTAYPYVAAPPPPPNYYHQPYYPATYQADPDAVRRAIFLRRVLGILIAAFIIVGTTILIIWLVLRPRLPEFRVDSLTVSGWNSSSATLFSASFDIGITARNPNKKITLSYDELEADVFYRDYRLSDTTLSPFTQSEKNETSLRASAAAVNTFVGGGIVSDMNGERSKNGNVGFNVRMLMVVRFKAGALRARRRFLKAFCGDLSVGISSNSSNGSLIGGPKQCRGLGKERMPSSTVRHFRCLRRVMFTALRPILCIVVLFLCGTVVVCAGTY